ncbi:MAG: imidazoleglycerol-phosphate dehydratase HisB [Chthoniobacterales bacterium]
MKRIAKIERTTTETTVNASLNIDGTGQCEVSTGIGFLDHMLELFTRHGFFDISLKAKGDLHVDFHHTVEDTAIVLGRLFTEALGQKMGITRYGTFYVPMDEALIRSVVDLSGRNYFSYNAPEGLDPIGAFSFQLMEEFFRAFAANAGMNLHIDVLKGRDAHHVAEGMFKSLARALDLATSRDVRLGDTVPSTKGLL